ncbi:MAG: ketosteroid isomerase-like protein [Ilumatobacter sp.]|jgi:ketosteroid isomerase-like protein
MSEEATRSANLALLRAYFGSIETGDVDHLATYWADDLIFEAVFSYTGTPSQTVGKQAVYDRLSTSYGLVSMSFHITEIYELVDANSFIVEYTSTGEMHGTGESYSNRYITVVNFRDGKMTRFREFYDSMICAAAFGDLI